MDFLFAVVKYIFIITLLCAVSMFGYDRYQTKQIDKQRLYQLQKHDPSQIELKHFENMACEIYGGHIVRLPPEDTMWGTVSSGYGCSKNLQSREIYIQYYIKQLGLQYLVDNQPAESNNYRYSDIPLVIQCGIIMILFVVLIYVCKPLLKQTSSSHKSFQLTNRNPTK